MTLKASRGNIIPGGLVASHKSRVAAVNWSEELQTGGVAISSTLKMGNQH